MNSRAPWIIGVTVSATLLLVGCSTTASAPLSVASPSASQTPTTLGAGFYDPDEPPAPESTITPSPNSWDGAHPPAGYTAILLTTGDDKETATLVSAVQSWADEEKVELKTEVAATGEDLLTATHDAIDEKPDLIISVGNGMVDALAAITPSNLQQQFLIVGAEVAEPTYNVTAADWTGAGYRGEGLGTPTEHDTSTFTPERAGRAIRAGVASIVNNLTGIVIWVD